ncbi:hypothetical protein ABGV42_00790 [Paenibacillus pabuli]|uniref:hypothetical protein n=1 Tax=Paenibacillus pabuli TaxID=1472 RepID=UPI0032428DBA
MSSVFTHITLFVHDGKLLEFDLRPGLGSAELMGRQYSGRVAAKHNIIADELFYEVYVVPGYLRKPTGAPLSNDEFIRLACGIGLLMDYEREVYYPRLYKRIQQDFERVI